MSKIRALLAEDHAAMVEKVADLLSGMCDIAGSVTNGLALLDAADREHPDVIVMDISMPVMSGIEAARRLIDGGTQAKIVFLTVHDDADFVRAALATGASGYVLKSRMATDLIPAIKQALAGHRFISQCCATVDPNTL